MGLRSYLRDVVVFYIFYKSTKSFFTTKNLDTTTYLSIILLFFITLWFLLERVGILPKTT